MGGTHRAGLHVALPARDALDLRVAVPEATRGGNRASRVSPRRSRRERASAREGRADARRRAKKGSREGESISARARQRAGPREDRTRAWDARVLHERARDIVSLDVGHRELACGGRGERGGERASARRHPTPRGLGRSSFSLFFPDGHSRRGRRCGRGDATPPRVASHRVRGERDAMEEIASFAHPCVCCRARGCVQSERSARQPNADWFRVLRGSKRVALFSRTALAARAPEQFIPRATPSEREVVSPRLPPRRRLVSRARRSSSPRERERCPPPRPPRRRSSPST